MNLVVLSVLLMAILPLLCAGAAKWGFKGYDNKQPRAWLATQTGFRARANAAQANSWEALAVFGPAAALALVRDVPSSTLEPLALLILVTRVVYIGCYLADAAFLRSVVWLLGYLLCLALFVLAL